MPFCFRTKHIDRDRSVEAELAFFVMQLFIFYCINAVAFIASCVKVVQILNIRRLCKSYCQCVHCVVTVVVALCPVFYTFDFPPVSVFNYFGQA